MVRPCWRSDGGASFSPRHRQASRPSPPPRKARRQQFSIWTRWRGRRMRRESRPRRRRGGVGPAAGSSSCTTEASAHADGSTSLQAAQVHLRGRLAGSSSPFGLAGEGGGEGEGASGRRRQVRSGSGSGSREDERRTAPETKEN
jgi:hypothetical protein